MAACYFSVNGDNGRTRNEFWKKKFWMNIVPLADINEGVEMSREKKKIKLFRDPRMNVWCFTKRSACFT